MLANQYYLLLIYFTCLFIHFKSSLSWCHDISNAVTFRYTDECRVAPVMDSVHNNWYSEFNFSRSSWYWTWALWCKGGAALLVYIWISLEGWNRTGSWGFEVWGCSDRTSIENCETGPQLDDSSRLFLEAQMEHTAWRTIKALCAILRSLAHTKDEINQSCCKALISARYVLHAKSS